MKLKLEFVELHTPLFLAGTNMGAKLIPSQRKGLEIHYLHTEQMLIVQYNGKKAMIPSSNVASMVGVDTPAEEPTPLRAKK